MNAIPSEVLLHLFHFLSFRDVLRCRQVCRRWKRVADCSYKLERVAFIITSDTKLHGVFQAAYSFEAVRCLVLDGVAISYRKYQFQWDSVLPRLRSLTVKKCEVPSSHLIQILSQCFALESLSLICLRDLFLSGMFLNKEADGNLLSGVLTRVTFLDLSDNPHLSDSIFLKLVRCMPQISSLNLSGCNIINRSLSAKSVFTFPTILNYLTENRLRIKNLNLSCSGIDNKALLRLSEMEQPPSLESLHVGNCTTLSELGILSLLRSQEGLKSLHLGSNPRWMMSVESFEIMTRLLKMEEVSLAGLTISEEFMEMSGSQIVRSTRFRKLDISNVKVYGKSFLNSISRSGFAPKLESLNMSHFQNESYKDLVALLRPMRNLQILILTKCERVNDTVVRTITRNLKRLKVLDLNGCGNVTDAGFREEEASSLGRLSDLRTLKISSSKLTALSNESDFVLSNLSHIDVSHCEYINDVGFGYLGKQIPYLETLTAKKCGITNTGFIRCTGFLKNIVRIDVEGCHRLSGSALSDLPRHCKYLNYINISYCHKIDAQAVRCLQNSYSNLSIEKYKGSKYDEFQDLEYVYGHPKNAEGKTWKHLLCCSVQTSKG